MIPSEELAQFAVLYDRFANHLDPLSDDWQRRKQEYLNALDQLHQTAWRRSSIRKVSPRSATCMFPLIARPRQAVGSTAESLNGNTDLSFAEFGSSFLIELQYLLA